MRRSGLRASPSERRRAPRLPPAARPQAVLYALPSQVAPDLAHAVVRRDGADPAAGVRRRGGLVQAPDRGPVIRVARGRAHVEELLGRELAVEDVAPDETDFLLHVVGPDHLAVHDGALEVRRELGVAVDHAVRVRFELFSMRLFGPFVRYPLREQRHDMVPLGTQRAVEHGRYDAVRERPARRLPAPRVLEGLLDVVDGVGQLYSSAMKGFLAWIGGKARQPR